MAIERVSPDVIREKYLSAAQESGVLQLSQRTEAWVQAPTLRSLGRLLVDFDDLRDLVDLLARSSSSSTEELRIEFETGTATTVDDLVELSDAELVLGLVFLTDDLTVALTSTRATAYGPRWMVEAVYEQWATFRRTQALPRFSKQFLRLLARMCGAFAGLTVLALAFAMSPGSPRDTITDLAGVFATLSFVIPGLTVYFKIKRGLVVFFPGTRKERREDRPLQLRHRYQMGLTMIGSVLVPIVSLLVTIHWK